MDEPRSALVRGVEAIGQAIVFCGVTVGLGTWLLVLWLGASEAIADALAITAWGVSSVAFAVIGYDAERPRPRRVAHGSAEFMNERGVRSLTKGDGLIVGRDPVSRRLIRYGGPAHLVTVAPTRSGKGVGSIIPNLLTYEGAVVCVDPKGENARVTAAARRRFGPVWVLDPFGASGEWPSAFNPLDAIDLASPDAGDAAGLVADALVHDPPEHVGEAHWNEEARALIAGTLLHVASDDVPARRTLAELRRRLTLAPSPMKAMLDEMSRSAIAGGLVARAANRQLGKADREAASVLSSAQRHTHFLDSPRIVEATARSDLALGVLGEGAGTLYLVLPPERLATHGRWLRLMVAQALTALAGPGARRRRPVLFLLDELAALGRLDSVAQAMSLMAGYGVQLWAILQDIHQLRAAYGRQAGTFLSNAGCLQVFNVNDQETAEWVSRLLGDASVDEFAGARADDLAGAIHAGSGPGFALPYAGASLRRPLLAPDEVRRLPDTSLLLFMSGCAPVLAAKVRFYVDREFARLDARP